MISLFEQYFHRFRQKNEMLSVEILVLIPILLLAFFLRTWKILEIPKTFFDELDHGLWALNIINKEGGMLINHFFNPLLPMSYHGPMIPYILIPSIHLFGISLLALRAPAVLFAVLTIVFTYLFAKEFYNKQTAFLASFILSIMPGHVLFSRETMPWVYVAFFLALCMYLLVKDEKTKKKRYFYIFALVCSFGVITRLTFLFFLLPLVLAFKIYMPIKRLVLIDFLIAFILFLLVTYPLLYYNIIIDKFSYLRHTLKDFPITYTGQDLSDIKSNLLTGLLYKFPSLLEGTPTFLQAHPLFFLMFVFSLTAFLFLTIQKWKKNKIEFKKNLFIATIFFGTVIITSIFSLSNFWYEEYELITPLIAVIMGKAFCELFEILKKHNTYSFYLGIFFVVSLFLYQTLNFSDYLFFNFSGLDVPFRHLAPDIEDNIEELSSSIVNLIDPVNSSILVDDYVLIPYLGWDIYRLYNKGGQFDHLLFREKDVSDFFEKENVTYIFSLKEYRSQFLSRVNQFNKTIVLEKNIYSKSGEPVFTIYHIN